MKGNKNLFLVIGIFIAVVLSPTAAASLYYTNDYFPTPYYLEREEFSVIEDPLLCTAIDMWGCEIPPEVAIYGELYTHNIFTVPVPATGIWENATGINEIGNFSILEQGVLDPWTIKITRNGTYLVSYSISMQAPGGASEYDFGVSLNSNPPENKTHSHRVSTAAENWGVLASSAILELNEGDKISIQLLDEDAPARDLEIINANLNIHELQTFQISQTVVINRTISVGGVVGDFVNRTGDIMNGSLNISGTGFVNLSTEGTINISSHLMIGGNFTLRSGEVIIWANGTVEVQPPSVVDIWVNVTGDIMTGDLNITNGVGSINLSADGSIYMNGMLVVNVLDDNAIVITDDITGPSSVFGRANDGTTFLADDTTWNGTAFIALDNAAGGMGFASGVGVLTANTGLTPGNEFKLNNVLIWDSDSLIFNTTAVLLHNMTIGIGDVVIWPNGTVEIGFSRYPGVADDWVNETGDAMSGNLTMNNNWINGFLTRLAWGNITSIPGFITTGDVYVNTTGDLMTGDLNITAALNITRDFYMAGDMHVGIGDIVIWSNNTVESLGRDSIVFTSPAININQNLSLGTVGSSNVKGFVPVRDGSITGIGSTLTVGVGFPGEICKVSVFVNGVFQFGVDHPVAPPSQVNYTVKTIGSFPFSAGDVLHMGITDVFFCSSVVEITANVEVTY